MYTIDVDLTVPFWHLKHETQVVAKLNLKYNDVTLTTVKLQLKEDKNKHCITKKIKIKNDEEKSFEKWTIQKYIVNLNNKI